MSNHKIIALVVAVVIVVAAVGVIFFLKEDTSEYNKLSVNISGDGIVQIKGTDFVSIINEDSVVDIPSSIGSVTLVAINDEDVFEKWTFDSEDFFVNSTSIDMKGDESIDVVFSDDVSSRYNQIYVNTSEIGIILIGGENYEQAAYYDASVANIPIDIESITLTAESLLSSFKNWTIDSDKFEDNSITIPVTNGLTASATYDKILDARNRIIDIPDSIESILAIKSCSSQLVSYFDAVNKITHIDSNEKFEGSDNRTHSFILADLLSGLPTVDPNDVEQVIMANVDIIISSTVDVSELDREQSNYKVPVFAINADVEFGSDIYYEQILILGDLFGEKERAHEIVNTIIRMLSEITDNVEPVDDLTGYACGMNFFGAGGFLKVSGNYLPFEYSKLENSFESSSNKQPYNTNIESVIANNPGIIFIDGGGLPSALEYINNNKGALSNIDAIANNNVYKTMVYKSWGTNWINQLINVYYVASVLHPDSFDWDFEDKADDIIQLFYPGTDVTYADIASAQTGGGCDKVQL